MLQLPMSSCRAPRVAAARPDGGGAGTLAGGKNTGQACSAPPSSASLASPRRTTCSSPRSSHRPTTLACLMGPSPPQCRCSGTGRCARCDARRTAGRRPARADCAHCGRRRWPWWHSAWCAAPSAASSPWLCPRAAAASERRAPALAASARPCGADSVAGPGSHAGAALQRCLPCVCCLARGELARPRAAVFAPLTPPVCPRPRAGPCRWWPCLASRMRSSAAS